MSKVKPDKIVHLERKSNLSLTEFATQLEVLASKLKDEGAVTFKEGDQETFVSPSRNVTAEFKYVTKGTKHEFEIELKWREGNDETFLID